VEQPDVAEVAVTWVPHERSGRDGHAVVTPVVGSSPDGAELIAYTVSPRTTNAHWRDVRGAPPSNPAGKILKREIPQLG